MQAGTVSCCFLFSWLVYSSLTFGLAFPFQCLKFWESSCCFLISLLWLRFCLLHNCVAGFCLLYVYSSDESSCFWCLGSCWVLVAAVIILPLSRSVFLPLRLLVPFSLLSVGTSLLCVFSILLWRVHVMSASCLSSPDSLVFTCSPVFLFLLFPITNQPLSYLQPCLCHVVRVVWLHSQTQCSGFILYSF